MKRGRVGRSGRDEKTIETTLCYDLDVILRDSKRSSVENERGIWICRQKASREVSNSLPKHELALSFPPSHLLLLGERPSDGVACSFGVGGNDAGGEGWK